MMFSGLFVLALSLAAAEDPTQAAFEVTEKRIEEFQDSRAELEEICRRLKDLGDPRVKEKNETDDAYFQRIHQIYVYRGQGLVLLQMEYEEALAMRYELEADLDFYLWQLSSEYEGFAAKQQRKIEEKKRAEQDRNRLQDEARVVRSLLYAAAKKAHDALSAKTPRTWREEQELAALADDLAHCRTDANPLAENINETRQRYRDATVAQLRETVRDVELRAETSDFRYRYLEYELTPQDADEMNRVLGERYGAIFQEARQIVEETKDLEKRAAKVAVLAEQTREHLRELRNTRSMIARRHALLKFVAGEAGRIEAIGVIAGIPVAAAAATPDSAGAASASDDELDKMWQAQLGGTGAAEPADEPPPPSTAKP